MKYNGHHINLSRGLSANRGTQLHRFYNAELRYSGVPLHCMASYPGLLMEASDWMLD
jgi:hypothetical protein